MKPIWQWVIGAVVIVMAANELVDTLPRLVPSLVVLALVVIAIRVAWDRTRW